MQEAAAAAEFEEESFEKPALRSYALNFLLDDEKLESSPAPRLVNFHISKVLPPLPAE